MSTPKLGENISREWQEEAQAPELWDALQLVKSDPPAGIEALERLAEDGSPLAKVYLGDILSKGKHGIPADCELGERWLKRAASEGSIEGAYGLAWHLLNHDGPQAAIAEYQRLATLGYAPALFVLGFQYWKGQAVEKDVGRALAYLKQAEDLGHLEAANSIGRILMRERLGPVSWLRGLAKRVVLIIPFVRTAVKYPSSDLLRT